MQKYLIKNINLVNEGRIETSDVLISNERIEKIESQITRTPIPIGANYVEIDGAGKYLLPGCIDDQVHFREPGLTHKASIYSESRAAIAGGVTSFMEMPNTQPPAFTHELLEDKYQIASQTSLANYSFFMGTSNDNIEEVLKTNSPSGRRIRGHCPFLGRNTATLKPEPDVAAKEAPSCSVAALCPDAATKEQNRLALHPPAMLCWLHTL